MSHIHSYLKHIDTSIHTAHISTQLEIQSRQQQQQVITTIIVIIIAQQIHKTSNRMKSMKLKLMRLRFFIVMYGDWGEFHLLLFLFIMLCYLVVLWRHLHFLVAILLKMLRFNSSGWVFLIWMCVYFFFIIWFKDAGVSEICDSKHFIYDVTKNLELSIAMILMNDGVSFEIVLPFFAYYIYHVYTSFFL